MHKKQTGIEWTVTLFIILSILLSLILVPIYFTYQPFNVWIVLLTILLAGLTNLSITAGYHRLFSHRSYEAHPIVEFIYLFIGASAFQGSALKWSSDHRRHHSKVDSKQDPYSIQRGFFYAHMGWLFLKESTNWEISAADLEKNKMVAFQHHYYILSAFVAGFLFPMFLGWILGDALGGLLIAGLLRIVLTQQSTFLVNSLAHTWGKQTYSIEITARDSWLVAFLTHGEGFHNFHHKFQADYRNAIRWYQWDPTKWTIYFLYLMGLASKLRKISEQEILKARLQVDEWKMRSKGYSADKVVHLKEQILVTQKNLKAKTDEYKKASSDLQANSRLKIQELKTEMNLAKLDFKYSVQKWSLLLKQVEYGN